MLFLVGLGRLELPTSPLSGVRSNHLSYRPRDPRNWWSWSGSNRRPPACKAGALPAELQPQNSGRRGTFLCGPILNRGRLDARTTGSSPMAALTRTDSSKWRCQSGLTTSAVAPVAVWSGTAASYFRLRVHSQRLSFADSTHVLS